MICNSVFFRERITLKLILLQCSVKLHHMIRIVQNVTFAEVLEQLQTVKQSQNDF